MGSTHEHNSQFEVAIIGGGIIGLITAMGLLKRNIPVKIYEQASSFRELGAGVSFTANALKCMTLIDPKIREAVDVVATPNGEDPEKPNDYVRYHDGYHWDPNDPENTEDKLLYRLFTGYKGFQGCQRAHLVDELVKSIPAHAVEFRKRVIDYEDPGPGSKLKVHFADGTSACADLLIGCDGVKSKVRQLILGPDNPASYPHFSKKVAYRALVPMEKAEAVLGSFKARNQHMHTGPKAHILHFPVVAQTQLNVVAFLTEEVWPLDEANGIRNMTATAARTELEHAFREWCPTVRNLVSLLPERMDKWAIFDTYDHPPPTFVRGRVCIAGDAAHATSPHHGAGAGIGVEDALALCTLIERLGSLSPDQSGPPSASLGHLIEAALKVYDEVRPERGGWLVQSSRQACEIYEWNYPETGSDPEKCLAEITRRSHKLWYFDIEDMLEQLRVKFERHFKENN